MDRDGTTCLICHDALLDAPVGALECGHVYHVNCVASWLFSRQGKQECPQCKRKTTKVRTLEFEVKQLPGLPPEELHRLQAATAEDRARKHQELAAAKEEASTVKAQVDDELALLREEVQEHKKARKKTDADAQLLQEENVELSAELFELKTTCAQLQAGLDAQTPRIRKLPISQPREGDTDLQEERRKLRIGLRPSQRARRLHEDLMSAREQEKEKLKDKTQREAVQTLAEEELKDKRQQEVLLRRNLEDRRSVEASEASSQASSALRSQASVPRQPCSIQQEGPDVTVEVATPQGIVNLRRDQVQDEEEDATMLYGAAPPRRPVRSALMALPSPAAGLPVRSTAAPKPGGCAAAVNTGGGKWGALFGAAKQSPAAANHLHLPSSGPQPVEKVSMKTLFANRQA